MLDDADHARTAEHGPARSLGALDTSTPNGGKRSDTFATAADHSATISPRGD
jgi:hypothetical protein